MKKCWKCGIEKPESEYNRYYNGLQPSCKQCTREYLKTYRQSKSGKESMAKSGKKRREVHADKVYARAVLQRALKEGKKFREPCEKCGASPAQAHHPDYSKPLDVQWLCPPCHVNEHA